MGDQRHLDEPYRDAVNELLASYEPELIGSGVCAVHGPACGEGDGPWPDNDVMLEAMPLDGAGASLSELAERWGNVSERGARFMVDWLLGMGWARRHYACIQGPIKPDDQDRRINFRYWATRRLPR